MTEILGRSRGLKRRSSSVRIQLGGSIIIALILPCLLRAVIVQEYTITSPMKHAIEATFLAIFTGTFLLRSLSTFPGVKAISYTMFAFLLSFGGSLLILFLLRMDYNRVIIVSGAVLTVAWFAATELLTQRDRRLRIGVVPGGSVRPPALGHIGWIELNGTAPDHLRVDAVIADFRTDLSDEWEKALADAALQGIPVYHSKDLFESLTGKVELEHLSENSFGSLVPVKAYMSLKHLIDWVAALVALAILWPALLLVALLVRLDSPGPALFRQIRIGHRGRQFRVVKFRTMRTDRPCADDDLKNAITQTKDDRITALGRFLRRSRIDELPQIINILRGDMSWIGPRPEATVLSRWYEQDIPYYRYRHIVRPGITGWAQVNQGHVADVNDVRIKLHYDFYYIKNYSPWLDLLIAIRTVYTMLTGFGSR